LNQDLGINGEACSRQRELHVQRPRGEEMPVVLERKGEGRVVRTPRAGGSIMREEA
jgi:hypothetical protein